MYYAAGSLLTYFAVSYSRAYDKSDGPSDAVMAEYLNREAVEKQIEDVIAPGNKQTETWLNFNLESGFLTNYAEFMSRIENEEKTFRPPGTKVHEYRIYNGNADTPVEEDIVYEIYEV